MAMATAVANKDKSIMEHLAIAKSALATAEMHGQVLATTFPDTFLAGPGSGTVICCALWFPMRLRRGF